MFDDKSYHAERAWIERDLAHRAPDERVSDARMRLSALRLSRAMILEELDRRLGANDAVPRFGSFGWGIRSLISKPHLRSKLPDAIRQSFSGR